MIGSVAPPAPTVPRLVLDDVSCAFGSVLAVEHLSLAIMPGEFVSLLGPSGCGKTSTLRMIAGFIEPSSGTIAMDGDIISSPRGSLPPERRQMSMIFQSYAIWPNMTVAENVAFGLRLRRFDRETIRAKVAEMLQVVQLAHLADRYPAALSGGQQQRVALARAMVIQPRMLLLDEPLSNLDANLREEMRSEIRRLHDAFKFTTVYVTHDQAEAMVTSDRIVVMNQGRIEQVDDPYTLYTRPRSRFVAGFIGRTNFIEGHCNGKEVAFGSFAVPVAALDVTPPNGKATFSVRPQSMRLSPTPSANGQPQAAVTIAERAYLGEFWDYVVTLPEGSARLRVTTPPLEIHEVGASAWLAFDPKQMTPIS